MKRKMKGVLFATLLVVAGLFGVSSTLIDKQVNETPVVEKADAANTIRIYLFTNNNWEAAEPTVKVRMWNTSTSSNDYVVAIKADTCYYYADIDTTNHNGCQFQRFSTDGSTYWNGSSEYNTNFSNRYCTLTGYDNSSTWVSVSDNSANETYEVASTSPSTSTKRIWVNPKDNFYDSGARAGLRVFSDSGHYKTYILGGSAQYVNLTHESTTQYFFYVDIPVDYGCQLVRLHNAFDYVWTYSAEMSDTTTQFTFSWDAAASLATGGLDDAANYTVEYAQRVLDGFSTCSSSSVNGYGAYDSINTNVLSNLTTAEMNTLKASTFSASGYGTRTYGEKITIMSNSGSLPKSAVAFFTPFNLMGDSESNLSTIIIIIASSVSLLSITALSVLLVKKRKNKEQQ